MKKQGRLWQIPQYSWLFLVNYLFFTWHNINLEHCCPGELVTQKLTQKRSTVVDLKYKSNRFNCIFSFQLRIEWKYNSICLQHKLTLNLQCSLRPIFTVWHHSSILWTVFTRGKNVNIYPLIMHFSQVHTVLWDPFWLTGPTTPTRWKHMFVSLSNAHLVKCLIYPFIHVFNFIMSIFSDIFI